MITILPFKKFSGLNESWREALQDSWGRTFFCTIIPLCSSVIIFIALLFINKTSPPFKDIWDDHDTIMKFLCGITGALSLMTYNLRNKSLDYFQKLISSKTETDEDIVKSLYAARQAGIRITNLTIKSFFTMLLLGWCAYFLNQDTWFEDIILAISIGFLTSCIFSYFYVIFRMEYVESKFLKLIAIQEEILRQKEAYANLKANKDKESDTELPDEW